jgi:hypothetical protein
MLQKGNGRLVCAGALFEAASRRLRARSGGCGSPLVQYIKGLMQGRQMPRSLSSIALVALGVAAGAQAVEAQPAVTRVHGIATGIAACWRPPHDDDQITVRVSFTRDGGVIGEPRIVFVQSSGGRADDAALAQSMVMAIRDCTPLHFSAQLGSAIAGQVLDIRFIGRIRATIVAPP